MPLAPCELRLSSNETEGIGSPSCSKLVLLQCVDRRGSLDFPDTNLCLFIVLCKEKQASKLCAGVCVFFIPPTHLWFWTVLARSTNSANNLFLNSERFR